MMESCEVGFTGTERNTDLNAIELECNEHVSTICDELLEFLTWRILINSEQD